MVHLCTYVHPVLMTNKAWSIVSVQNSNVLPVIVSVSITILISCLIQNWKRATVKLDWNNLSLKRPIHSLTCQTPHPTERTQLLVIHSRQHSTTACTYSMYIWSRIRHLTWVACWQYMVGYLPPPYKQPWREAFLLMKHQLVGVPKSWCLTYSGTHCAYGIWNWRGWQTLPWVNHRWSYLSRTTANVSELLKPIEETNNQILGHQNYNRQTQHQRLREEGSSLPCLSDGRARLWHHTRVC